RYAQNRPRPRGGVNTGGDLEVGRTTQWGALHQLRPVTPKTLQCSRLIQSLGRPKRPRGRPAGGNEAQRGSQGQERGEYRNEGRGPEKGGSFVSCFPSGKMTQSVTVERLSHKQLPLH
ncbi:hypothetical protein LEMLEM_LOCUS13422, partial [Lemmus lemmus]